MRNKLWIEIIIETIALPQKLWEKLKAIKTCKTSFKK